MVTQQRNTITRGNKNEEDPFRCSRADALPQPLYRLRLQGRRQRPAVRQGQGQAGNRRHRL